MFRVRMADLPLAVKVGLAPGLALVMVAALGLMGFFGQEQSSAALKRVVEVQMPERSRMRDISEQISVAHGELYRLLTHKAAQIDAGKIDAQMKALSSSFTPISKELVEARDNAPGSQRPMFNRVIKQLGDTQSAVDLIGSILDSDFATAAGFAAPFEDSYRQMAASLHQLTSEQNTQINAAAMASYARVQRSVSLLGLFGAATLIAVALIGGALVGATRRDIHGIASATEALAGGDNDLDLDSLKRGDELGAIVESLAVFRENQRNLARLRREQEQADLDAQAARAEKLAEDERLAGETRTVVAALGEGLEQLAEGDLTFRIAQSFPTASQKLKDDFNRTMEQLQSAVGVIVENASRMRAGAGEISHAADDLSRRTEQQAATLEETAAALDQITVTVRKTADGASQARNTVSTTKADAEKSGVVVRRGGGCHGSDRDLRRRDRPDHRRDRRDRLPDQPARPQRRGRGRARRRRRSWLRGGGDRGARAGPAVPPRRPRRSRR